MKRQLSILFAAAAFALPCLAQNANVYYAEPRTVLSVNVEVEQEYFFAGPYAKYAHKFLGIEAGQSDRVTSRISSISITTAVEADPAAIHTLTATGSGSEAYLQMTAQGLIAGTDKCFSSCSDLQAGTPSENIFSRKVEADVAPSQTRFKAGIAADGDLVRQTPEDNARDAALRLVEIREMRYKILIGDTDATYSGEALEAAVNTLAEMEQEYLALFTGYSEKRTQKAVYNIVPSKSATTAPIFRISDKDGLTDAQSQAGTLYRIVVSAEDVAVPQANGKSGKPENAICYRIPAVCTASITDGSSTVISARVPVYQLGAEVQYPINSK